MLASLPHQALRLAQEVVPGQVQVVRALLGQAATHHVEAVAVARLDGGRQSLTPRAVVKPHQRLVAVVQAGAGRHDLISRVQDLGSQQERLQQDLRLLERLGDVESDLSRVVAERQDVREPFPQTHFVLVREVCGV